MTSQHLILTESDGLSAIDPETGATIWKTELGDNVVIHRMAINEGVIVLATARHVHCCQYDTGTHLWSVPIPYAGLTLGLVVEGGRVYVLTPKGVFGLDGYGRQLFHRPGAHSGGSLGFKDNVCWAPYLR